MSDREHGSTECRRTRWPGNARLAAAALLPAVLLAAWRGHGRLLTQLGVTLAGTLAGLHAQYLVSAVQGVTGQAALTQLNAHLDATADRVLLFPALLCALAVPLLAGLALHSPRPPPVAAAADGPVAGSAAPRAPSREAPPRW
jgi:hypothetical protein